MKIILSILFFILCHGASFANEANSMVIDVEAGEPQTICFGETLDLGLLGASISGDVTDGLWFTMGDGVFLPGNGTNGIFSLTEQYQPGPQDLSAGEFTLILVSDDPDGNGPMVEVSDQVTITFMNAPALVCNNSINVSLAESCEQEVDVFMVLANPAEPYDKYQIEILDENGVIVPNNILTVDHLETTLSFTVSHACTNSFCGGEVTVSDYVAPFLNCFDATVDCELGVAPEVVGFPIPFYATATAIDDNTYIVVDFDACSDVTMSYQDVEIEMACASTGYVKEITRSWFAEDASGNSSSCSQVILVNPLPLSAVMSPPDYDGTDEQPLSCDGNWEALDNGYPSPESTGMPAFPDCGNIDATSTDVYFEECGAGFKVVRQWFVIDWCTSESFTDNQIIKILDQEDPEFVCPGDITLSTQAYDCVSKPYDLEFVEEVSDCSDYDPSYKILTLDNIDITDQYINSNTTIDGLPAGEYQLVYIATDVCSNASQCTTALHVIDDTAPFAVCDGFTQISLSSDGMAELWATSIDDESFDNCGDITMEIAKMTDECGWGLNFAPNVRFCCEEVGDTTMVAFRVTDSQGQSNTCMVSVFVEDKLPPVIECPSDITISCSFGFDLEDLSIFGSVVKGEGNGSPIIIDGVVVGADGYFEDNCDATVSEISSHNLDCGSGTITRTFTATDLYDQSVSCSQTITIESDTPFLESDIQWPTNFEMNGCDTLQADPTVTGEPILSGDKCALVASTYEDQFFFISGTACVKVLREWTVIDWCQFDATNGNIGIWTYLQEIKLKNTIAPEFVSCEDVEVCSYDEDCTSELVTIAAHATDDCTDSLNLLYLWKLDLNDDGTIDETGQGITFTRELLFGDHRVFWTAEDGCGNSNLCDYKITVKDCKNPTPYCNSSITTTIMPSAGMIEIWAEDFDFGSYDNCTNAEDLIFSFSPNLADNSKVILCEDIVNGVSHQFILEFWVTDENGNQDKCDVTFIVQDNADACPNGTIKGKISGKVITQHEKLVPNVELGYTASIDTFSGMEMTDSIGVFELESTPEYLKYVFRPSFESDPYSGVSTLDLVMIQQHILEIKPFDNPYDIIASDVSQNEKVTSSDLLTMRKMVLGIISEWPKEIDNWVFVDSAFVFQDESYPFYFPDSIVIENLSDTAEHVNFVAIKMGDVNGSYKPSLKGGSSEIETRNNDAVFASISKKKLNTDLHTFDVIFETEGELTDGLQFSLRIPEDAEVHSDYLSSGDYVILDDVLKVSWINTHLVDLEGTTFLSITTASKDALQVDQGLSAEMYFDLEAYPISFEEIDAIGTEEDDMFGVEQLDWVRVVQNPFAAQLDLIIQTDQAVQIDIFDAQGKRVYSNSFEGRGDVQVEDSVFDRAGLYVLKVSNGGEVQTEKLVRI